MSLSCPLHSRVFPVLLVMTFSTHIYSNKFTQSTCCEMMYQRCATMDTWCYGWTSADSWPSVALEVLRFNIISVTKIIAIKF